MVVYALSVAGYLAFVVYGYRAAEGRVLIIGWTFIAALAAGAARRLDHGRQSPVPAAADCDGGRRRRRVARRCRAAARFIRAEFRELAGVFLVVVGLVVAATLASALAWSGVGLIAFVPLVGLAVFPLQLAALLVRGLVFEYLGLTALGAYLTLYLGYASRRAEASTVATLGHPAYVAMRRFVRRASGCRRIRCRDSQARTAMSRAAAARRAAARSAPGSAAARPA